MCSAWLVRRFPARDSRWRTCSPEDTSIGAVPLQLANLSLVANRAMSPVSARIRPAVTAPTPSATSRWASERPVPRQPSTAHRRQPHLRAKPASRA
jgi:hypothetical protein